MKRIISFLSVFIILFNIPFNFFTASSAIPTVIPLFDDVTTDTIKNQWYKDYYYGSILVWDESQQIFMLYMFRTKYQNLNSNYITLIDNNVYPSENPVAGPTFKIGNQSHLQGGELLPLKQIGTYSDPYRIKLRFSTYSNQSITSLSDLTFWCSVPTIEAQEQTSCTVIASDVDIKFNDEIVYKGNAGLLQSYFYENCLPYNEVFFSERPVYDPNAGQDDEFDTNYDEVQVETSKNILDNVKNIITSIANLPSNIANNIKSFFEQLSERIQTGLSNLKDGIIQGLKELFIPSDNAFTDIVDMVKTKFTFAYNFVDIAKTILVFSFDDDVEPPNFKIEDSSGNWFKGSLNFIDWTIYEPYRPYVHALILAICWYQFIERTIKRLPSIIGGI